MENKSPDKRTKPANALVKDRTPLVCLLQLMSYFQGPEQVDGELSIAWRQLSVLRWEAGEVSQLRAGVLQLHREAVRDVRRAGAGRERKA